MSKSKKVELQITVQSQDQWEQLLQKDGLIVVDAYSAWCGPCKAMVSTLKRIKNEVGDSLLHFAIAQTDNIDSLALYRGKSQPTFLFYANGTLVYVIRGCDCPVIIKMINKQLEKEHRVMEGRAERTEYIDKEVGAQQTEEKKDEQKEFNEDEEEVEVPKEVSLAIIKPDAVKAGLVDEIIAMVEKEGMEILRKEERTLTKDEAAEFYKQHEGSDHFEELCEFMCSGPCLTLIISKRGTGDGVIPQFRDLIGPKDVNVAKEKAPTSIRALYGTSSVMNAVHACDTSESAARELAFFFPDFVSPAVKTKKPKPTSQRTLALIRPDALRHHKDSILAKVKEAGFSIAMAKELTLSREEAEDFYAEHKDKDFFESLVSNMCSGPVMALCLAREDAVEGWRQMLGPKEIDVAVQEAPDSLRAQFKVEESDMNPLHGSDSQTAANKEIEKIFPVQTTVAVIKPETAAENTDAIINKIEESGFRIISRKNVGLTKELASQFYHEHDGKDFFNGLTDYMSSGQSTVLLLEREDAVYGWRTMMGPTDPEEAREKAPDSIRAVFGKDILKNAVHGSSNVEQAGKVIEELFPDVEVLPSGRAIEQQNEDNGEKGGVVTEDGPVDGTDGVITNEDGHVTETDDQLGEKNGQMPENGGQDIEQGDLQGEETTVADNSDVKDGGTGDVSLKEDGIGEEEGIADGESTVANDDGGITTDMADNNTGVATDGGVNDTTSGITSADGNTGVSTAGDKANDITGSEDNGAAGSKANGTAGSEVNNNADAVTDSGTTRNDITTGDGTTSNNITTGDGTTSNDITTGDGTTSNDITTGGGGSNDDASGGTALQAKSADTSEGVNNTIDGELPKDGNSGDQGDGSADGGKHGATKDGDKSVDKVTANTADADDVNGSKDNITEKVSAEKVNNDSVK